MPDPSFISQTDRHYRDATYIGIAANPVLAQQLRHVYWRLRKAGVQPYTARYAVVSSAIYATFDAYGPNVIMCREDFQP